MEFLYNTNVRLLTPIASDSCFNVYNLKIYFAVITKKSSEFNCRIQLENGNIAPCVIDSKNRQSCKKCRFEKCLSAGMNPNWVTNENEGF
jgi:hypothetical protein